MPAGQLRELLAFESRGETEDGYGNPVAGDWAERFQSYARIMPLRGGETVMAARLAGRQPVIISVRVSENTRQIAPEWRARDVRTGVIYAITSPPANMDEKNRYFDILATSGVAA